MTNIWARFRALLPGTQELVGEVTALNSTAGTSTVTLPGGGVIIARGTSVAVGGNAYVKDGVIISAAPDLALEDIEI